MTVQLCEHVTWDMHEERWLEISCKIKDDHGIMHKINASYWVFCGVCKRLWGNKAECGHVKTIEMCTKMQQPQQLKMEGPNLLERLKMFRGQFDEHTLYPAQSLLHLDEAKLIPIKQEPMPDLVL